MSWRIHSDRPGDRAHVISDADYAQLNFGNGVEDTLQFTDEDGAEVTFYLNDVSMIVATGPVPPTPGMYPGWMMYVRGPGGTTEFHVDNTTKTAVWNALSGPGSEDTVITFTLLEGPVVRLYTRNLKEVTFSVDPLLIPEPE